MNMHTPGCYHRTRHAFDVDRYANIWDHHHNHDPLDCTGFFWFGTRLFDLERELLFHIERINRLKEELPRIENYISLGSFFDA